MSKFESEPRKSGFFIIFSRLKRMTINRPLTHRWYLLFTIKSNGLNGTKKHLRRESLPPVGHRSPISSTITKVLFKDLD